MRISSTSRDDSGQVVHTHLPVSPSSILLYRPKLEQCDQFVFKLQIY